MRLYARQGRRAAALRQYQVCVGVLQRELGTEPEAETKQLYREILQRRRPEVAGAKKSPARATRRPRPESARLQPELPAHETPLIGRDSELARLRRALDETWQGRGQVVVVVGVAGIGKTRLIGELAADALKRGGRVLLGRCYESMQILPFGPWVDAVRSGQISLDTELLGALAPAWRAELARLLPEVEGEGLPAPSDDYLRLFEGVAHLVKQLVSTRPVVVMLEDLHWADEMSLRLLSFLGRRAQAWPVALIATAREEELADAPALRRTLQEFSREAHVAEVRLPPLSQPDTMSLVGALIRVGHDAAAVTALQKQIWTTSQGNPFMVVETVRALREGGPGQGSPTLPLPERVREVITGRLERLSDRSQQLVAVAAVIGCEFEFPLLAAAARLGERQAAEGVEELARRRILHGVGDRFDFTHDRIREVAYRQLLPPTRRVWHLQVGEAIERLYAQNLDAHCAALSVHFREAQQWSRAVGYATRFAETAARAYSHAEAVQALQAARDLVDHLPPGERDRRRIDLALRLAYSLYFLGRFADSLDLLAGERERVERLADPSAAGPFYFWLADSYMNLGDQEQAAHAAQRALQQAAKSGDEATMGKAHYVFAQVRIFSGRPEQGAEHATRAIRLLERAGEHWWLGHAYWSLGGSYCYMGAFDLALEAEARGRAIGEAIGDRRLPTYTACLAGWAHAARGDCDAAIEACRRGVEHAPDPLNTAAALAYLGYAYLEKGEPEQAIPLLTQAVERFAAFKLRQLEGRFTTLLGDAYLAVGRLEEARGLARRGLAIASAVKYGFGVGWAHRTLGRIARAAGAAEEAQTHFGEALRVFTGVQARFEAGRTHLALAETIGATGDCVAARAHLEEAAGIFAALRLPSHEARTRELLTSTSTGASPPSR